MAVTINLPIENTITDGSLNPITSNAVFDGLAGKASGTGTANGTNTGDETQSTIKTKLGSASSGVDGYLLGTDWTTFNGKQNALGFTPEDVANKQTDLTASATKYPTVNAVNTGLNTKISKHVGSTYTTNAIQTLTAAEYALITPDASTLYFIV